MILFWFIALRWVCMALHIEAVVAYTHLENMNDFFSDIDAVSNTAISESQVFLSWKVLPVHQE